MRHMLTAFIAGEIDPLMFGRIDTEHYQYGLALCENFVAVNEGPLVKRPGFFYVCDAHPTSRYLSAFRYSITQEYMLEWRDTKVRFYTNGVRIETSPGVPYEVTTPYSADDIVSASFQQSFDRLYIDHENHPPASLSRTSATTFVYGVSDLVGGPFADANIDEFSTVQASGTSGSVTITASNPIFTADHVGALMRIEAKDFSDLKAWEAGMRGVAIADLVRSDGKAYSAATAGKTGANPPIHSSGSEWDGQLLNDEINNKGPYGVRWEFVHGRFGIVRITAFTSATEVTATVIDRLPNSVTTVATDRWAHGAFSAAAGWPSLVVNWQGRQLHIKGTELFGSVVGGYLDHSATTKSGLTPPDLAFRRTIASDDPPLWVTGDRRLILGTATRELSVGAINAALAVSGDNISAEPQSFYGSAAVYPAQVGVETVFVERGGRRLRAAGYDFARDRYASIDLTVAARHITRGGVRQLAQQRLPHALLFASRNDGALVVHAQTRAEIKGFSRWRLGGKARASSVVAVVGEDGVTEELWALVDRNTDSGLKREIWKQAPWREQGEPLAEAMFVDGGKTVQATAGQVVFTGFEHLAGEPVAVLANGGVVPGIIVDSGGTVTLPATAVPDAPFTVTIGLPYTAQALGLSPDMRIDGQPTQGLRQRVVKAALRLLETVGIKTGGGDGQPVEDLIDRPGNAPMDAPIPLFSGDTEAGIIDGTWDRKGQLLMVSDQPLPCTINAAMLKLNVDREDA
jgi:hypothetical protein